MKQTSDYTMTYSQLLNEEKELRKKWRGSLENIRETQDSLRMNLAELKAEFKAKLLEAEQAALEKAYGALAHLLGKHSKEKSQALQQAAHHYDKTNPLPVQGINLKTKTFGKKRAAER